MDPYIGHIIAGLENLFTNYLGEFLIVQFVLILLNITSRLIIYRRQLDDRNTNKKLEGWFNVCIIGPDLCLVGIAGVFVSASIQVQNQVTPIAFYLVCLTAIIILFFLDAFILGSSSRRPKRLLWDKTFFWGAHIPNAVGFLAIYFAAGLIVGNL
ncbi:MAG: hypothetical protein CV087_23125 [Candidatus Brocadia sp. WS118]|nr:MAG: hypothetical protein CV087_23125 [Candidatus Brocadia sp. WS118]